ncbi:dTDP-4-dehydrorhamnose 3,5-epimerase [Bacillus sp. FJAT-50079]|uniref:dTDP-4-dehydrorhamnose 3,5-epimerase n=1 Tax=Bacillus sp. FJAT-50079 TaxID=2833577 RepID=UPI001BC93791|nr:dTDP-4-dehydrorhamnose 3,5-epimerase [Bacillus sp. FJAT-50079]MBS4208551.1 dTDP-4-dehydrorhamnose 3,5-epimerase [Bacillus sp. FJAT-50079]
MKIIPTRFDKVILVELTKYEDHRGYFLESYHEHLFKQYGIDCKFIQDNHSYSKQSGTIRGLHYQLQPKAQSKLVRVTRGAIYDVIVDIRANSQTYGKWEGYKLTAKNQRLLFVPKGFAHGFCTLVEETEVQYKVDEYYSPEHERGVYWNSSKLNIDWPVTNPIISHKDEKLPRFDKAEKFYF